VVAHRGNTWVIEIKVAREGQSAEAKAEEAMKQIIDKNYAAPYPDAICLGLGIDNEKRQITASRTKT
jgi:plasmid stability protein